LSAVPGAVNPLYLAGIAGARDRGKTGRAEPQACRQHKLLLDKCYEVHGIKRRASLFNTDRIDHLYQDTHVEQQRFKLHYGELTDSTNLIRIIQQVQPDEIFNLAAMSHVAASFETAEYTANADGICTLRIQEAIRILRLKKKKRFYLASTGELYGLAQDVPQTP
jgi:GDPmannose 4,6-dehydratase